jgi:polyhydroxybutyrate depolymerase
MMTHRLGMRLSQGFAAIAPVVATVFGDEMPPTHSVSALMINGMLDKNVPYAGGAPGGRGTDTCDGSPVRQTLEQAAFWAAANDCKNDPVMDGDNSKFTARRYPCPAGGPWSTSSCETMDMLGPGGADRPAPR